MLDIVDRLNKSIWCRLAPSLIHGVGVFAIRDIPKGTNLISDTLLQEQFSLDLEHFNLLHQSIQSVILDRNAWIGNNITFHSPNADANIGKFLNHSIKPNYDMKQNKTLCNICSKEEIVIDYRHLLNLTSNKSRSHMKLFIEL